MSGTTLNLSNLTMQNELKRLEKKEDATTVMLNRVSKLLDKQTSLFFPNSTSSINASNTLNKFGSRGSSGTIVVPDDKTRLWQEEVIYTLNKNNKSLEKVMKEGFQHMISAIRSNGNGLNIPGVPGGNTIWKKVSNAFKGVGRGVANAGKFLGKYGVRAIRYGGAAALALGGALYNTSPVKAIGRGIEGGISYAKNAISSGFDATKSFIGRNVGSLAGLFSSTVKGAAPTAAATIASKVATTTGDVAASKSPGFLSKILKYGKYGLSLPLDVAAMVVDPMSSGNGPQDSNSDADIAYRKNYFDKLDASKATRAKREEQRKIMEENYRKNFGVPVSKEPDLSLKYNEPYTGSSKDIKKQKDVIEPAYDLYSENLGFKNMVRQASLRKNYDNDSGRNSIPAINVDQLNVSTLKFGDGTSIGQNSTFNGGSGAFQQASFNVGGRGGDTVTDDSDKTNTSNIPRSTYSRRNSFVPGTKTNESAPDPAVAKAILSGAQKTGVSASYLGGLSYLESNFGRDKDTNNNSMGTSVKGITQFTDGTWATMLKKYSGPGGPLAGYGPNDRTNPEAAEIAAGLLASDNKAIVEKNLGRSITDSETYSAHVLGAGGATTFLNNVNKNPDDLAVDSLGIGATNNPGYFFDKNHNPLTNRQAHEKIENKFKDAQDRAKAYIDQPDPTTRDNAIKDNNDNDSSSGSDTSNKTPNNKYSPNLMSASNQGMPDMDSIPMFIGDNGLVFANSGALT